jgi:poly-gamma-glutamate synthesis protein (capsule biosynthesis protein)
MEKKSYVKITFTGDIYCTMSEILAHKTENGNYDFSSIFENCKDYFSASDYVVGNLETPIANNKYCDEPYSFNSPIEFADAIKKAGISLVTTANNHCLDRGVSGLEDTIMNLESVSLKHTGTNNSNKIPTGIVENFDGMNIGFLSYTYGTNAHVNKCYLNKDEKWKVNLYQEQELHNPFIRRFYYSKFRQFTIDKINKLSRFFLRKNIICPVPVHERSEKNARLFKRMKDDIFAMKKAGVADYLIMCLHAGGQLNPVPIKNTPKIAKKIAKMGVDAVIINHEHVIHYGEMLFEKVIVYSLGNFCPPMGYHSPLSDGYSLLFNLYLSKENKTVKRIKTTFSIVKTISDDENKVKTVPLFDLIKSSTDVDERNKLLDDNLKIYNLFTNGNETKIELSLEYHLN